MNLVAVVEIALKTKRKMNMKKSMTILLMMSLLSVSCTKSGGGSDSSSETTTSNADSDTSTPEPVVTTPTTPVINVPALALSFKTNIEMIEFTAAQEDKYNKAIEIVKLVVATEEFKNKVLNYTYNGSKTFADNGGKTNAQIYQSILDAAESLQPAKNNTMDLEVELYYAANTVVGYTYATSKRIWVNTKFFNSYTANNVSGNLFHEWLHKLGYTHDSAATAKRPYTVPYAVGYIMANIGKKFL